MTEERKMILEMVKEGTITVEEGEQLLTAMGEEEKSASASLEVYQGKKLSPKRLLVLVTENGRPKVNVRVPFSLVRVGLKLGQSFGGMSYTNDPAGRKALEALQEIDIDELLDSISDGDITLPYTMVDMDDLDKGEHVTIVLE